MKFSFRRRHGVLLAWLVSTGALGVVATQNAGIDLLSSVWSTDAVETPEADDASSGMPGVVEAPVLDSGYAVSNSFPTGFLTYTTPNTVLFEADNTVADEPSETPEESLDLVFEATGAGYSGRGMSRFLGASSSVELGAIVGGVTAPLSPQQYVASLTPMQGGYGDVSSRESTPDETNEVSENEEETTEPVIVGSTPEPGTEETQLAEGDNPAGREDAPNKTDPETHTSDGKTAVDVVEVDEPSTLVLLSFGLLGLGLISRRSRKRLQQA